jgi:hypothetical protein
VSSKYKNPSFTKNIKILYLQKIKILHLQKYKNPSFTEDDIHRLSPDGTFRDIVLSKHDGVDLPRGITFNNDFTKLFMFT